MLRGTASKGLEALAAAAGHKLQATIRAVSSINTAQLLQDPSKLDPAHVDNDLLEVGLRSVGDRWM